MKELGYTRRSLFAREASQSLVHNVPHARAALWIATCVLTTLYLIQVLALTFVSSLFRISWQEISGFALVGAEEFGAAFLLAAGLLLLPALIISESLVYRLSNPGTSFSRTLLSCAVPAGQSSCLLLALGGFCGLFTWFATQNGTGIAELLIGIALICLPLFSATACASCAGWCVLRQAPPAQAFEREKMVA